MRLTDSPRQDPSPQSRCPACRGDGVRFVRVSVVGRETWHERFVSEPCADCGGHGSLGLREAVRTGRVRAGGVTT